MSLTALRKMLEPFFFESYDRKSYFAHKTYKPGNFDFNSITPRLKENDNGELEDQGPPIVHNCMLKIADFWWERRDKITVDNTVFDPAKKSDHPRLLNIWSGFRLTEEQVRPYKDWVILRPYLNHIKWSWNDSEEMYVQNLRRFAYVLQRPGCKAGVAVAIGGEEGTGKTGVVQKLMDIVGEAHSALVHDIKRDLFGEFTAVILNKIVALVRTLFCSFNAFRSTRPTQARMITRSWRTSGRHSSPARSRNRA